MFQFTLSLKIQFVFWVQITKSGFLLVEQVDNEERTAIVKWYSETRRPGAWILMN
jgi:hypothetical protein